MKAWHSRFWGCLLWALGSAASAAQADIRPASQDAILAGVKTCIGATTDPKGEDARLMGWAPSTQGAITTNGRSVMRNNVLVAVTPGRRGACVVFAKADVGFRGLQLLHDIERLFGAKLRSETPPVLGLPNGEIIRIDTGSKHDGPTYVHMALVHGKGK